MAISDLELGRKLVHLFFGIIVVLLFFFGVIDLWVVGLALLAALLLSFVCLFFKIPVIYWFLTRFDRTSDIKYFPGKGAVLYLLGIFLAIFLFDKDIACASILILAVGDSLGAIFGSYFGFTSNPVNRKKYLEGTIIAILFSFFAAFIFVGFIQALCGSIAAMFIESFDLRLFKIKIDDNLIIPLVSGSVIFLVSLI